MADANVPAPTPPEPGPWWARLVDKSLSFVNQLNNERLLLLAVVSLLAYLVFSVITKQTERETTQARMTEESRTEERRHCDVREEKAQQFFASQMDLQRRHDDERDERHRKDSTEREEKMQVRYSTALEAVKVPILTLLGRVADIERILKKQ
jgi:hypothetical protein